MIALSDTGSPSCRLQDKENGKYNTRQDLEYKTACETNETIQRHCIYHEAVQYVRCISNDSYHLTLLTTTTRGDCDRPSDDRDYGTDDFAN